MARITKAPEERRLEIIKPYTNWVRSFSCTEGNELIPRIAKEYDLKTLVGAWLGKDPETNEKEILAPLGFMLADEGVFRRAGKLFSLDNMIMIRLYFYRFKYKKLPYLT